MSPSTFDNRIGPKLVIVARTDTPIPEVPRDRNSTGKGVGVHGVTGVLGALLGLVVGFTGPRQAGEVALDVGHDDGHARRGQLFCDHLKCLCLAGTGGACDQAVAVDGGQRDTHLGGRVTNPVDDDGAQLQRLALGGVTCGDPLGGGGCRLGGHGSHITGQGPRGRVRTAACRPTAYCEACA